MRVLRICNSVTKRHPVPAAYNLYYIQGSCYVSFHNLFFTPFFRFQGVNIDGLIHMWSNDIVDLFSYSLV